MSWLKNLLDSEAQPQSIYQILTGAADSYVNSLINARISLAPKYEVLVSEVQIVAGEVVADQDPFRRMRLDFLGRQGERVGPIIANLDDPRQFRTMIEHWDGIEVQACTLVWNGIDFRTDADLSDTTPLIAWYLKWMDQEEKRPEDENGLHGVVHSTLAPDRGEDGDWIVPVDFGSAPIEAFSELIAVFRQCGAKRIRIESFETIRRL
jgi:hypothetical protein